MLWSALWWLGYAWCMVGALRLTLNVLMRCSSFVSGHLWGSTLDKSLRDEKAYMVWTGCTDGIGRALLRKVCAKYPRNPLILVGRNAAKLAAVKDELTAVEGEGRKVELAVVDLGKTPETWLAQMKDETIGTKTVGLLVNCAGDNDFQSRYFDVVESEKIVSIINVNIRSLMLLTRLCLPSMVQKRTGVVLNVGSLLRNVGEPMAVVYAASKCGVASFSEALQTEMREYGIVVQCHEPGLVATKMTIGKFHGGLYTSLEQYVTYAFNVLINGTHKFVLPFGYQPVVCQPHPLHWLLASALHVIPSYLVNQQRLNTRLQMARSKAF